MLDVKHVKGLEAKNEQEIIGVGYHNSLVPMVLFFFHR
jgi:hypothetical protein